MLFNLKTMTRSRCLGAAIALLISGTCSFAQSGASVLDLSGSWERMDDVGGGSFGGILDKIIPKAALQPEIVKANQTAEARQRAGDVVAFSSKWCQTFHYPFFMQHSAAWHIVQTADEVIQIPEVHTFARHIYLDGRKHPDPASMMPNVNGHSIGKWQGNSLIVDTVGFEPGGGTPGGGRIGPATHLTEKFALLDGGKKLQVTFTWEDPAIFLKPHTYDFIYYKSAPGSYALEDYCHADEATQSGSVVQPKQQ
jgi:hypothetical protein